MRSQSVSDKLVACLTILAGLCFGGPAFAAELRSTANDLPVQRQVRVNRSANASAKSPARAASSIGLASHVEQVDYGVLVDRQPPAPRQPPIQQSAPRVAQRGTGVPSTGRPTPSRPRPALPASGHGVLPHETIIQDDVVWDDSPLWEHSHGDPYNSCCGNQGCGTCCPDLGCNLWFNAEMLVWWRSGRHLPTLVTTGPTAATASQNTLFGGQHYNSDAEVGGRVELGYWLTPSRTTGVGMRYWQLGTEELDFSATSGQFPVLARPFLNVGNGPGFQDVQLISSAGPPVTTGSVDISSDSDALGADVYLRRLMTNYCGTRIEYLLGYQLSRIDEDLTIRTNTVTAGGTVPAFAVQDSFRTQNEFHGISLGLMTHTQRGCWNIDMMTKFGLGNMQQTVGIDGFNVLGGTIRPDGLLARSTNIGTYSRDRFGVVPEFNFTAARQLSRNAELTIGYSALVYTGVVQPGDQIDPELAADLQVPPNVNRPGFVFNDRSYVIQGLNFGFRYRY